MMVLILSSHLFQTDKDSLEIIAPLKSFKTRKCSTVLQGVFWRKRLSKHSALAWALKKQQKQRLRYNDLQ